MLSSSPTSGAHTATVASDPSPTSSLGSLRVRLEGLYESIIHLASQPIHIPPCCTGMRHGLPRRRTLRHRIRMHRNTAEKSPTPQNTTKQILHESNETTDKRTINPGIYSPPPPLLPDLPLHPFTLICLFRNLQLPLKRSRCTARLCLGFLLGLGFLLLASFLLF